MRAQGGTWALSCLVLLALLRVAATEEFDVTFDTPKPLGVRLDAGLVVVGFSRGPHGEQLPAEVTGWIKPGDRLVAVNDEAMGGRGLTEVATSIGSASVPKRLRFAAAGGGNRTAAMAAVLPPGPTGVLELWRGGMPLGALPYKQAAFGGRTSCRPAPLVLSVPSHGCFAHGPQGTLIADALLITTRGECAWSIKAVQAQAAGALGLLVINDDVTAVHMQATEEGGGAPSAGPDADIVLPAVMIGSTDGVALRRHVRAAEEDAAAAPTPSTKRRAGKAAVPKPLLGRLVRSGQVCKPLAAPAVEMDAWGVEKGDEEGLGDVNAVAGEAFVISPSCGAREDAAAVARAVAKAVGAFPTPLPVPSELAGGGKYSEAQGAPHLGADGLPTDREEKAVGVGRTGRSAARLAARAATVRSAEAEEEAGSDEGEGGVGRAGRDIEGTASEEEEEVDAVELAADGEPLAVHAHAAGERLRAAELERDTAKAVHASIEARALRLPASPRHRRAFLTARPCAIAGATVTGGPPSAAPLEYVRAGWSGPLPTGPLRLILAQPPHACEELRNEPDLLLGAAILVMRGECPFGDKRTAVLAAGGAVMIVANDVPDAPLFAMTAIGDPPRPSEGKGAPSGPLALPSVLVTAGAGAALRARISAARESADAARAGGAAVASGLLPAPGVDASTRSATLRTLPSPSALSEASGEPFVVLMGRPSILPLWEELSPLADPVGWPSDGPERRKTYLRLMRVHHPDRSSGSGDRAEALMAYYKRAQAKWAPNMGGEGWGEEE